MVVGIGNTIPVDGHIVEGRSRKQCVVSIKKFNDREAEPVVKNRMIGLFLELLLKRKI